MKKDKLLDMNLGDRMKFYESQYELEVKPEQHIICRIDGHKFSKFTKGFIKPYDFILSEAMRLTTQDLLTEFNATTSYTQSDEITLVIPSLMNTEKHKGQNTPKWCHGYSGRVQKMASLIAGFTTMKFNKHLRQELYKNSANFIGETQEIRDKYTKYFLKIETEKLGNAWFDCRVYGVDSDEEAYNSVMWRVRDAEKNSRSMFAQHFCSHRELQGKTGPEQVQYCKEKTGEDWETVPKRFKYGILVKKEIYEKEVAVTLMGNHKELKEQMKGIPSTVQRSRVKFWSEGLTTFSDDKVDLIMRKYK